MSRVGLEGLPLFEQENDPAVPLRARYANWRRTDQARAIVRYIESVALNLHAGGATRISINQLVESARARFGHVNNNWRSLLARELIGAHPALAAVLETRPLKGRRA